MSHAERRIMKPMIAFVIIPRAPLTAPGSPPAITILNPPIAKMRAMTLAMMPTSHLRIP
jgi:hypothetical protein